MLNLNCMQNSVSIVMTTFNGERYLKDQLDSFLNQTRLPDDLIICDDNSTDSTIEIIKEFIRIAPFNVRLYRNRKNLGYTRNFSKAMSLCDSDIVFLSDQDDVWYKRKIEVILNYFNLYPHAQLLIHDLEFCDEDLNPIGQTKLQRIQNIYNPNEKFVTGMATAIRNKFLQVCLSIPDNPYITYDNWIHGCAGKLNIKRIVPEVLSYYRRHPDNTTYQSLLNVPYKTTKDHFNSNIKLIIKSKTLPDLTKSIMINVEFRNWFKNNISTLVDSCYGKKADIEKNIISLNRKIRIAQKRANILALNRHQRILPVIKNLIDGGYKEFNGFMSASKDIFFN